MLQEFSLTAINQLWVADITYIPLYGQQIRLSGDADGSFFPATNRLASCELTMTEAIVLERAARRRSGSRQPTADLIHHTDRGGQYAGKKYRAIHQA